MTDLMTNGMFRGICVDNQDPKNLGRIRVQVPQILGTATSGWAFPAWSFSETTIWPQDRLPKAGEGVWVMFDSTSPDKMIWMAAFGPLPLINQPEFVEKPDFESSLTMNILDPVTWNTYVRFAGVLTSDLGGIPNPNATIYLSARVAGGDWQELARISPDPLDGVWENTQLIHLTGNVEYRAGFDGVGVYGPAESETVTVNTPAVAFPTTLTIAMTDPTPAFGEASTFSGTLLTSGSPPAGYTVPGPNAAITLSAQQGAGAWTPVMTGILVNGATGAWTTSYTISISGSVNYRVNFATLGVFNASQSSTVNVNTALPTVVSAPVLPALVHGSPFSVSGNVKTAAGAAVTTGTVDLWWRYTAGADVTFKKSTATATLSATGTYSLTHSTLAILGATEWQVRYVGTPAFTASNSAAVAATVNLPATGALTKGTVTLTTAAFSWAAVSGATSYEVQQKVGTGAWTTVSSTNTTRTWTVSSMAADTLYSWQVRAKATNYAGTVVYTGYSPVISLDTGHAAVTIAAATTGYIYINCWADDSWRNDGQDWGAVSDMRQGYFSSAYGGEGYTGCAIYKGSVVKDAVIAGCGTDGALKQSTGTCYDAEIELERLTDVGTYASSVATVFYRSTTLGSSGGKPGRSGTGVSKTLSPVSAGKVFYDIGTAHGQAMGDGTYNSIVIYKNTSDDYAAFHAYRLRLRWTWPAITKTAAVATAWN